MDVLQTEPLPFGALDAGKQIANAMINSTNRVNLIDSVNFDNRVRTFNTINLYNYDSGMIK